MLCQACQKNEATVHLTEIKNDKIITIHLCEQCAREKGINVNPPFSLSDFLSSLAEIDVASEEKEIKCPQCGLSWAEFRSGGRLGCGHCYRVFSRSLLSLITSIQKGVNHHGKVPAAHPARPDLETLQKELQDAVGKEEYEKAARLRDLIKQLGKKK